MAAAAALLGRAAGLGLGLGTGTGGRRLLRCGTGAGLRVWGTGTLLGGAVVCKAGGATEQCLSRGISSNQRPKRPLTAYLRFVIDNRPAFREKNPGKAVTLARELQNRYAGFGILLKVKMFKELWSYWANPEEDLSRENHLISYVAHQFKSSTLSQTILHCIEKDPAQKTKNMKFLWSDKSCLEVVLQFITACFVPEASNLELIKKLAGAWKELPASQKQAYEEARKTDWKRYGEQMAAYKAQLTPAQAAALKEERRKQLAKRRSIRAKRELNLLGKPKRARSGFNIFLSENFQESEGISPVAKLKKLFDTWQKLSTSQKQPYLQLAEDDKVRYENEMKSWEAKMIELGREDLVRSKKQRLKKKPAETAKQAETAKASSGGNKAKLKKSEE